MREIINNYLLSGFMVVSIGVGVYGVNSLESSREASQVKAAQMLAHVREDLIAEGNTNGDRIFDLKETGNLLGRLGYDGIVEPGTRIDVYSPDSGEEKIYRSGDFVRVPIQTAREFLQN